MQWKGVFLCTTEIFDHQIHRFIFNLLWVCRGSGVPIYEQIEQIRALCLKIDSDILSPTCDIFSQFTMKWSSVLCLQAEEAYPVDQENQGNTLVSVAPLNPPAETQEKPSVNGESTEAAKTQPPPPTNGHPSTKTADTEMWNSLQTTPANALIHWRPHTHIIPHTCLCKLTSLPQSPQQGGHQGLKQAPTSTLLLSPSPCLLLWLFASINIRTTSLKATMIDHEDDEGSLDCWRHSGWERETGDGAIVGGKPGSHDDVLWSHSRVLSTPSGVSACHQL